MKKATAFMMALCMSAAILGGCTGKTAETTGTVNSETQASETQVSETAASSEMAEQTDLYDGGSGTEEDPYQIASKETLLTFASKVNDGSQGGYAGTYFKLTADIDLSGVEWVPIGNMGDMETHSTLFLGSFDGDNHKISNLTYEAEGQVVGAGLFGVSCGEVKNLEVADAKVTVNDLSSLAIGAVVGYNMGSVENITLSGESVVIGTNCVGGIIGGNKAAVADCTVDNATVVVVGDNQFSEDKIVQADVAECGGLVIGGGFGGTIDNCTAKGTVKAEGNEPVGLGGIGGCLEMMDSITNCTADVTIESAKGGHAIGGLCGYAGTHSNPDVCLETEGFSTKNYPSVIENCTVNVKITADGATHVGGLVGTGLYYYGEETAFKISGCTVNGSIDGAVTPGTIAGRAEGSTIENCTANLQIDGQAGQDEIGTTSCMYESADQ